MLSVSKNTIYSGIFFFFVLLSIFVLRPFRNTIAADIGTADLTLFLFIVVLVMLLVNPIYSFIVSKSSQKRLVPYIYGFFIINLLSFLALNTYLPESFTVKATFYVWYNIFNFFWQIHQSKYIGDVTPTFTQVACKLFLSIQKFFH